MDLKQEITEILETRNPDLTNEELAQLIVDKFHDAFKE